MQLLIVSDGCVLENRWPFWTLISFAMFQSIWLFIFLITCCCVVVRQAEEEYPEKKIVKSQIKQKTQSLPSPSRPPPSPKKLSKSKDSKPKKKYEQKQKKEEPKQRLGDSCLSYSDILSNSFGTSRDSEDTKFSE
uniref:Candidate secreted effector n=1 Tax=Meloidogyne incognita TaxID=6306 RepID=A0A914N2M8_MELIC